jgi:hypothetical protein
MAARRAQVAVHRRAADVAGCPTCAGKPPLALDPRHLNVRQSSINWWHHSQLMGPLIYISWARLDLHQNDAL